MNFAALGTDAKFVAERVAGRNGLLVVSAGFDALLEDPLAQCRLRPEDYVKIGRATKDAAETLGVPVVLGLEGGYSTKVGEAFAQSIRPWLGNDDDVVEVEALPKLSKRVAGLRLQSTTGARYVKMRPYETRPSHDRDDVRRRGLRPTKTPAAVRTLPRFLRRLRWTGTYVKDQGSGTKFYGTPATSAGPGAPPSYRSGLWRGGGARRPVA